MTDTEISLSVLIVSYNSSHLLADCIEPLRQMVGDGTAEIIVVDNASSDDPSAALSSTGIDFVFIESDRNGGFAHAVNIAARRARGRYFVLLNPDVTFEPKVMSYLLDRMDADTGIAAIAPLLVTQGVLTANGGRLPTASAMWAHASGLARAVSARNPMVGHFAYASPSSGDLELEWLSGGFIVIRRAVAPVDGLLSERWFMYAEDIDLSVYLSRRGRLVLATDVTADHAIGGSSGGDEKPRTMWVAAIQDFHREVLSRRSSQRLAWRLAFAAGFYARALILLVKRQRGRATAMSMYARACLSPSSEDAARVNRDVRPLSAR